MINETEEVTTSETTSDAERICDLGIFRNSQRGQE